MIPETRSSDVSPLLAPWLLCSCLCGGDHVQMYAAEVIADSSGKWVGNALLFQTEPGALEYVSDLAWRWMAVRDSRVVPITLRKHEIDVDPGHRYTPYSRIWQPSICTCGHPFSRHDDDGCQSGPAHERCPCGTFRSATTT